MTAPRNARLGDLADIERNVVDPQRMPGGTKYVGLEHIAEDGTIEGTGSTSAGELKSAKFAFTDQHVLYGKLRPYLRKVARPPFSGICSTDILPILSGPDLDKNFLFHYLRQPLIVSLATARSDGVNLPRLSPKTLLAFPISLPPIAEQRRIAAMLDKADGVRRKRRESLRLLDAFLRSAFLEMFGDPIKNEKGWPSRQARSAISAIDAGSSVKGDPGVPGPGESAVLKISAVTSGWYLPAECKVVATPPAAPVVPKKGDLLFSRANTRELVAATCLVDRNAERVFLPDKLWRITPNGEVATPEYLRFLLASPRFRTTLTRFATGTSGSMLNVSQEKLLRLPIPLPPFDLQKRFAALVWTAYGARERLLETSRQSTQLFDSLAQWAFRGEL